MRPVFPRWGIVVTLLCAGAACSGDSSGSDAPSRSDARSGVAPSTTATAPERRTGAADAGRAAPSGPRHDDTVYAYGRAAFHGSTEGTSLRAPIVDLASGPGGGGYWLVARDGGVFSFGAPYFGSTAGARLAAPVTGIAARPDGRGYWLVARDGGVFSFGRARFAGSTGNRLLNAPIELLVPTPRGDGYWLVARDGGVFSFGAARYFGSAVNRTTTPVVGMAATPTGQGYWLATRDGRVFAFGDAERHGSPRARGLRVDVVGIAASADGAGYWLATSEGGVFSFGRARFHGSATARLSNSRVIASVSALRHGGGYRLLAVRRALAARVTPTSGPDADRETMSSAPPAVEPPPTPSPTSPLPPAVTAAGVVAVGDSVMIDAAPALRARIPGIAIHATVSMQASTGVGILSSLASSGQLPGSVVWHLGTNGTFSAAQLEQVLQLAAGRRVVVLTNHCGYCSWTPANNAVIRSGCLSARNCVVADWDALANANPSWFGSDGVHMPIGGTGAQAYAQLVVARL